VSTTLDREEKRVIEAGKEEWPVQLASHAGASLSRSLLWFMWA
jgi:hypothetical protein